MDVIAPRQLVLLIDGIVSVLLRSSPSRDIASVVHNTARNQRPHTASMPMMKMSTRWVGAYLSSEGSLPSIPFVDAVGVTVLCMPVSTKSICMARGLNRDNDIVVNNNNNNNNDDNNNNNCDDDDDDGDGFVQSFYASLCVCVFVCHAR